MTFRIQEHIVSISKSTLLICDRSNNYNSLVSITRLRTNGGVPKTVEIPIDNNEAYSKVMMKIERIIGLDDELFSELSEIQNCAITR